MDLHRPNAFISMLTIFATWASCCKNYDNNCCPNIFLLTLTKPDSGDGLLKRLQVPISKKKKKKKEKKKEKKKREKVASSTKFLDFIYLLFVDLRALASENAKKKLKKKLILHPQTPLYLFYEPILQLTLHPSFYFYIQSNKII